MSFPEYPEYQLPPPETGPFERNQSTRETDIKYGVTNFALVERAFRGTQEVSFLFNSTQAAYFRAFWLDTLLRGGRWFTTRWPLPSGWFSPLGLRKFLTVPRWRHIGNGAWRVNALTEIVAVKDPSVVRFSSLTYPITSLDSIVPMMDMANVDRVATVEAIMPGIELLSGELAVKLHTTDSIDAVGSEFELLEGDLRLALHTLPMEEEAVHSSLVLRSGTIKPALIRYEIDPEFVHSEMICLGGTLE